MINNLIYKLTNTEKEIYYYLDEISQHENFDKTIREIEKECHVSKATIMRMTKKLGFESYLDLKKYFQTKYQNQRLQLINEPVLYLEKYLNYLTSEKFIKAEHSVVNKIVEASILVFVGIGNSASLAEYAERYFSNLGFLAFSVIDPFREMVHIKSQNNILAIYFSVSGETIQIIEQHQGFKDLGIETIAVTSNENSTLAKKCDLSLTYPATINRTDFEHVDITTQVPVIFLIETLAKAAYKQIELLNEKHS